MGTVLKVAVALAAMYALMRVGMGMLGSLARPLPEPPPEGEMRRVNLRYRCPTCGTEIRMTRTVSEEPVAPRHCMDEMDLIPTE